MDVFYIFLYLLTFTLYLLPDLLDHYNHGRYFDFSTASLCANMSYVDESKGIAIWLQKKLDGLEISSDERTRTVAGCFDTVLEHQVAISILLENQLVGSAFALARSVFEGYVRGIWLNKCATDAQVSRFLKGRLDPKFQELIDDIEKEDGYTVGAISDAKKASWTTLNGFTHTGSVQVLSRHSDEFIEPNYSESDIEAIAGFVNTTALLAGVEIACLAKTEPEKRALEFLDKMKEYAGQA